VPLAAVAVGHALKSNYAVVIGLQSTGVAATVASKTREPTPLGLQSAAASGGQEKAASSCQETSVRTFARLCRQECDTHCNALQHPATLCRQECDKLQSFEARAKALDLPAAALPTLIAALGVRERSRRAPRRMLQQRRDDGNGGHGVALTNLAEMRLFNALTKLEAIISSPPLLASRYMLTRFSATSVAARILRLNCPGQHLRCERDAKRETVLVLFTLIPQPKPESPKP